MTTLEDRLRHFQIAIKVFVVLCLATVIGFIGGAGCEVFLVPVADKYGSELRACMEQDAGAMKQHECVARAKQHYGSRCP